MTVTESNCERDVNGVIFHKNSEISKAAKQEKAKDKLLSVLQLTHPCFNVYIFIQEVVCVCVYGSGGEVFPLTNKPEPIDTQSSVKCSSIATLETSFPSVQSSAGILLLCFE